MKILFVAYDNDSHVAFFPMSYAYLAAVCRNAGYEVSIYQQDIRHWPDRHLTEFLNQNRFDVVGLGACAGAYPYKRIVALSEAINNTKNRPFFVLGGQIATPEPEYFLRKTGADAVVLGEGEYIFLELLNAIANKTGLSGIEGVAYMSEGKAIINKRASPPDVNTLPFPSWDLFEMEHYVLNPYFGARRSGVILTGRGCTSNCTFCYRMERGLRLRDPESIIEEAEILVKTYDLDAIGFYDELFITSPERAAELSEAIIKSGLNIKWACLGRVDTVTPEVLSIMKTAGCAAIAYGMESMDDEVLRRMNKRITSEQIIRAVEMTMDAGMMVGFNFIFGNLGDTPETLKKSVDFLLKYERTPNLRSIRPVTPYPGSALYTLAVKRGLIKDCADFYENKHINPDLLTVNFTDMSDDTFYAALHSANKQLFDHYHNCVQMWEHKALDSLYINKDLSFRRLPEFRVR